MERMKQDILGAVTRETADEHYLRKDTKMDKQLTFEDLRDRVLSQRNAGICWAKYGEMLLQIYESKLPEDEVVFNIRRSFSEEPDVIFNEHFANQNLAGRFWVYVNKEKDKQEYPRVHEEFRMSEPLENFKKVYREIFHDGRFDYIIDALLADCNSD